jgi:hypothetical protein
VAEFDSPQGPSGLFASQQAEIDRGNVERDARQAAGGGEHATTLARDRADLKAAFALVPARRDSTGG